jgi:hypothetical protein
MKAVHARSVPEGRVLRINAGRNKVGHLKIGNSNKVGHRKIGNSKIGNSSSNAVRSSRKIVATMAGPIAIGRVRRSRGVHRKRASHANARPRRSLQASIPAA